MTSIYLAIRLNRAERPPEGLSRRIEKALPFLPDRLAIRQNGRSILWGFLRDEGLWPAPRWHETASGAAIITGYGVHDDARLLGAADILDERDLAVPWRRFHGEWSACRITDDGISAVSADVGTEHLYAIEHPDFVGVSNRARLLWETMKAFGARPEADLSAVGSLLSMGYPICTDGTAVRGVRLIDSTASVVVPGGGGALEVRALDPRYFEPSGAAPSWDELAETLRSNAAWLRRLSKPRLAALTGGRDSRLVLAMLKSARLVTPASARRLFNVAEVVLGVRTSAAAMARVALASPLALARAFSRKQALVRQLYGMLTLAQLCEELRADEPTIARVA